MIPRMFAMDIFTMDIFFLLFFVISAHSTALMLNRCKVGLNLNQTNISNWHIFSVLDTQIIQNLRIVPRFLIDDFS